MLPSFSKRTSRLATTVAAAAALAVPLALGLSGCSNSPYPPGEQNGSVVYRTLGDDPKSLDPTFSYTVDEAYITDLIYPSFYKYHYLKRDPFQLELNLGAKEPLREAVDVTVKDKDGKAKTVKGERYTFTIKGGLVFQDDPAFPGGKGRAITAKDIIYSFKRMADPTTQCPVASFFADKVVGWEEYSKAFETLKDKNYDNEMEGVRLDPNDPLTFTVTLSQPYPQMKYLMAMHFTTPQAREAVEKYGDEYARHPVGCGPYRMTEYRPKQRIILDKSATGIQGTYPTEGMPGDAEKGLLKDAGKPLPLNDRVVFNIVRESTSSWNLFLQGYLDGAGVGSTNYQQAITPSGSLSPELVKKGVVLHKEPQMNVYYGAFNMNDPVWGGLDPKKRKLRQAVSLAMNAQEYIDLLLQGNGVPAQWVLPPSVFGHDEGYKNPYRQWDPDLTRARQLLAEAGYPNGIDQKTGEKLVLNYDNSAITPLGRVQVGIVTKMIERIGIKVNSRTTRPNVFQDKLLKGQHQFIIYGWFADYPDPENFVFLLYGPNKRPGPNSANYANPEYDRLFEQMRSMDDSPARLALIKRMREVAVEDAAWIPLYHSVSLSLNYDWLGNVKAHPIANDYNQYRTIDVEKRRRLRAEWNRPNLLPLIAVVTLFAVAFVPAVGVIRQRLNRRVRRSVSSESEGGAA